MIYSHCSAFQETVFAREEYGALKIKQQIYTGEISRDTIGYGDELAVEKAARNLISFLLTVRAGMVSPCPYLFYPY